MKYFAEQTSDFQAHYSVLSGSLSNTAELFTDSRQMADTSYTLESAWRDMPLVEFCWLMWAHSVWLWLLAVPGRNMMWVVMRITASTTQLFMQPKEFINLAAKKTGTWLTTFCPGTLVSFRCWDRSDWHNHYFLRKTSSGCWSNSGGCSFNIQPTSSTNWVFPTWSSIWLCSSRRSSLNRDGNVF